MDQNQVPPPHETEKVWSESLSTVWTLVNSIERQSIDLW